MVLPTPEVLWAKKPFGDAVRSNPANAGVIVLYADENIYDITADGIHRGRTRSDIRSEIGDRIQVVYGGYRAPQVEFWLLPGGARCRN